MIRLFLKHNGALYQNVIPAVFPSPCELGFLEGGGTAYNSEPQIME